MLGGVARLFYRPWAFRHAYELAGGSRSWTLDLCLGCCSEMTGGKINVTEMIDYFAPKNAISYIHFRDVKGTVPNSGVVVLPSSTNPASTNRCTTGSDASAGAGLAPADP